MDVSHPFFRKKEWIPIVILLLFGICFYAFFLIGPSASYAEIYVDGRQVMQVDLSEDRIFSPPGADSVLIEVKNHSIGFISSTCPDHLCIRSGFLSKEGQLSVCLPNKVTIKIPAKKLLVDDVTAQNGGAL